MCLRTTPINSGSFAKRACTVGLSEILITSATILTLRAKASIGDFGVSLRGFTCLLRFAGASTGLDAGFSLRRALRPTEPLPNDSWCEEQKQKCHPEERKAARALQLRFENGF